MLDQVFLPNDKTATSKLWQVQGAIGRDLFRLPGGMLNATVGAQYRHESLNNPSANPANDIDPYARYYTVNGVGVQGARNIWSVSYEVAAPIIEQLRVKASGSYDHYSTGQKAFSPKFEAEFQPIREIKLRGTWSRGFRAPNFNESFQLPATGYTSSQINCTSATFTAFCAAHASNPAYYSGGYTPGLTSVGNPESEAGEVDVLHARHGHPAAPEHHVHDRLLQHQDQEPDRSADPDVVAHQSVLSEQWYG